MVRISPAIYVICIAILVAAYFAGNARASDASKCIRIIYSNDTKGYLEPCSCGGKYLGGLSRRATAISQLVKENPNTVIVESGNLSDKPNVLGIATRLLSGMGYDAVGVGAFDLAAGNELFEQAKQHGLKVIDSLRPSSEQAVPYMVKDVDGVRVGIVSYGAIGKDNPKSSADQAFYAALRSARKASDILLLLDQGGIVRKDWLSSEAGKYGTPDIVIGGVANISLTSEQIIGTTHVMPTWLQGTKIGVVDVEVSSEKSLKITARAITIDKNISEADGVKKQITDYIETPKKLAGLSPTSLNMGNIKKASKAEGFVTLTPKVAEHFTISKAYSSGKQITVSEWKPTTDGGGYRIRIVADADNKVGRFLETVSIELDLPDRPTLNLQVFGNVVDE